MTTNHNLFARFLSNQVYNCRIVDNQVGSHELMDFVFLLLRRKASPIGVSFEHAF